MKITTIVGARPQFIKAASISRAISKHNQPLSPNNGLSNSRALGIQEVIVHTGQHYDNNMSQVFFDEMQIPKPDYFLEVSGLNHGAMTGRMLEKIEEVLLLERPDFVLVYGDTNSTLAGSLAAKKLGIQVVHVEAGLRSFNMRMPEEINRILTDDISDILCCPTSTAVQNLKNHGFKLPNDPDYKTSDPLVVNTGDVMFDAALYYGSFSASKSQIINKLGLGGQRFALCTIHRAENTDDLNRLSSIFSALNDISRLMKVVVPLHPRTQKAAIAAGLIPQDVHSASNLHGTSPLVIIPPITYFDVIELLKHTHIVLTDSGGLQKEAFFFCKPCVTLRDETEWVELVEINANVLAGATPGQIIAATTQHQFSPDSFRAQPYGDGHASEAIVAFMLSKT